MAIIQFVVSLIVLGIIYRRMIRREKPDTISKAQAVVPVILGAAAVFLSLMLLFAISICWQKAGLSAQGLPGFIRSMNAAFIAAGLPEELAKLLMMLLALAIFRSRVSNVYEYILIGAGTGFGFALLEEFFYGSASGIIAITRLLTVASHMVFGIIMAKHLGIAKYNRANGSGSVTGEYVLALAIPILVHTLFDAGTGTNVYLSSEDEALQAVGILMGLAFTIVMFILQIVVLVRLKKNTEKYCGMRLKSADTQAQARTISDDAAER